MTIKNTQNRTELLCPVGDYESLEAAVLYGADAVYMAGKEFGMRKSAAKFDEELLKKSVDFAHQNGVKVYITCNTVPRNDEMKRLPPFLTYLKEIGVDAIIVSDLGTMGLCQKYAEGIPIHISVQAGITNYETANQFYKLGASRVILAREISLEEIKEIRENTPKELELEAFIHGAICMSHSGRCLLSNYFTGRDANRGDCAQPCRWEYVLMEKKREGEYFPVFEDDDGTYILNSRDLNLIEHIKEFIEAGVMSLKIEGRAKSSYYVSVVTNAYRNAIDEYYKSPENFKTPDWIIRELDTISHREYSTGFYYGQPKAGQCVDYGGYVRNYDVLGIVTGYNDGCIELVQRNRFFKGDKVEILEPKSKPFEIEITEIFNEDGESVDVAPNPAKIFKIKYDKEIKKGAIIRKKCEDK
jgi:putative protease